MIFLLSLMTADCVSGVLMHKNKIRGVTLLWMQVLVLLRCCYPLLMEVQRGAWGWILLLCRAGRQVMQVSVLFWGGGNAGFPPNKSTKASLGATIKRGLAGKLWSCLARWVQGSEEGQQEQVSVSGHQLSPRLWRPSVGKHLCYNPVIHTKKQNPHHWFQATTSTVCHLRVRPHKTSWRPLAEFLNIPGSSRGAKSVFSAPVNVFQQCFCVLSSWWPTSVSLHIWSHLVQVVMLAVQREEAPAIVRWVSKIEPLFFFCIWYLNIHTSQHSQVYNH